MTHGDNPRAGFAFQPKSMLVASGEHTLKDGV